MPHVKLNHICHVASCAGVPGDVIEVSEADAKWLLERGGATLEKSPVRSAVTQAPEVRKLGTK